MTKKQALNQAKFYLNFLKDFPYWNKDKDIVLAAVQKNGRALQYASDELKNDKEVVLAAIQQNAYALEFASDEFKRDREVILKTTQINKYASSRFSLLEGYKDFDEIVEKEGNEFLFSCCDNWDYNIRLQVAKHPNFLPTEKQIVKGLEDENQYVRQTYELRKDEWLARIEENKLRNSI